ncbi:YSIRK-type signal peptide-containing protein, partial [Staphylococcus gallinarum]|uniref:YSIRK-type signal peptide-containing protein n=2 Tax=Staphylococcus TaxID=1279 RepID=UPI0030C5322F
MRKSKRYDFLPNINNKYSIRKFTVGTASILVGATLIFGAAHDEAKAAEDAKTEEGATSSSNESDQPSSETANTGVETTEQATAEQPTTEESSTEESTKEEATTEVPSTEESTKEEATTEAPSTEESTKEEVTTEAPKAEESTKEETTTEAPKAEESTKEEVTTEAPKAEESTKEETTTEAPSTEESTKEETTTEAPSTEESTKEEVTTEAPASQKTTADSVNVTSNDADITKVTDEKSAVEYYAQAANVSESDAEQAVSDLNLDSDNLTSQELQFALINQLANAQDANTTLATAARVAPQNEEAITLAANDQMTTLATTNNSQIIEADAIANGYIQSQTDATNAANTLSGRAWIVDKGTPSTMSNGLTAVPEGTNVYLQWIDKDGAVSPTYVAKTTNQLSDLDGSQVGPGAYAFDLRDGWTDAYGTHHLYTANDGQYYRLWIEDFQTANGNTATMIRQAGGFFPGSYVNSVTSSNLGQFPLIGVNMQRTGIYMGIEPEGGYMTTDRSEWIHDTKGPLSAPSVSLSAKNSISGQVWFETGAGDRANSGTGPNNNIDDPEAAGYTVVMSSLTAEGAQAYKDQVESLPESERADAAKTLLTDHPEYISATVYGETDEDGRYTLRFPSGTLDDDYIYGYVMNPDGEVVSSYSSYTSPEFRKPNSNLSWTPQTAPAQNLVQNPMWYNVNFALVPTTDLGIEIIDFNNTDKPAIAGDEVHIDLTGTKLSPLPTHIEWRDKDGNVVQQTGDITSLEDGEQQATFVVPDTAQEGDIYTAVIVSGGNDVAADSFVVKVLETRNYDPTTTGVEKPYGEATTSDDVTGAVTVPGYPTDGQQPTITVDDPTQLPDGTTPGTSQVDVTVTYPDGTTDHIQVPVTVGEQADNDAYEPTSPGVEKPYGEATTSEDVTGSVTVPGYPADEEQPTITVDDPTQLPDGTTPGTSQVDVR